jgi:hypothetical protein
MKYERVKEIAQLASDCALASSVLGGSNKCVWDDYESLRNILLAKDDPNLPVEMSHSGFDFEITDTMTSEEAWKECEKRHDFSRRNNGGESNMTTWHGNCI